MLDYTLKTYAEGRQAPAPQRLRFYILSKGLNAGRPSKSPYCNSFEVTTESEEARNMLFWVVYALWKCGKSAKLIIGTAVPFIRIREYKKLLSEALKVVNPENVDISADRMLKAEKVIENAQNQIKLLKEFQAAVSKQMLSSKP